MTLRTQLAALENSGLISLIQSQPELEYLFRHALMQDAAYSSLLKADRKRLHRVVGETLEAAYPNQAEELAPLLAQHFDLAEDDSRALKYFTTAGDAAARVYANAEATLHYTRAIEIAKRSDTHSLHHLYTSLGHSLELNTKYVEALATYQEMETWAREMTDRSLELAALMARAKILATPNPVTNTGEAKKILGRAIQYAHDIGERVVEARALWNLMLAEIFGGGDLHNAMRCGEQSIAIARELNLREQLAFTLHDIFYACMGLNNFERGHETLIEANALWRELKNQPMCADSLSNLAVLSYERGDFDQCLAYADEAFAICTSIGNKFGLASSRFLVGRVQMDRGEIDQSLQTLDNEIQLGQQVGQILVLISALSDYARLDRILGQVQHGVAHAQMALDRADKTYPLWRSGPLSELVRLRICEGDLTTAHTLLQEAYRALKPESVMLFNYALVPLADAELALAKGDPTGALITLESLFAYLNQVGMRVFIPEAYYFKGQALIVLGRLDEAREILIEAKEVSEKIGECMIRWQIVGALHQIEVKQGHAKEADSWRRQAQEIIRFIAAQSPAELRQSFLNTKYVRAVL